MVGHRGSIVRSVRDFDAIHLGYDRGVVFVIEIMAVASAAVDRDVGAPELIIIITTLPPISYALPSFCAFPLPDQLSA